MTYNFDPDKLAALFNELESAGFTYGYDFKINPLSLQGDALIGTSGATGEKAKRVDCSGASRWAIWHMAAEKEITLAVPDGSMNQLAWARAAELRSLPNPSAGLSQSGIVIFFLPAALSPNGIGHVGFIAGGKTFESYGGHGPGSRAASESVLPWLARCKFFLL